eukprot:scaffold10163_cov108-Isochrysis_galbana.AAC.5
MADVGSCHRFAAWRATDLPPDGVAISHVPHARRRASADQVARVSSSWFTAFLSVAILSLLLCYFPAASGLPAFATVVLPALVPL